jgi:capsid protein
VNFELEQAWWDFGKRSNGYITKNGQLGDLDLDALILRTLAVDGEVFIHVDLDAKNPYGISFDLIDSLSIDWSKNQQATAYQNAIIAGVEVDKNYKPIRYWLKEGDTWNYQTGKVQSIPAEEIIHIYKH